MDLQRTLLIGAIAALSFMLLTEWVAFKDARIATTVQETSRIISDTDDMPSALPEPNLDSRASLQDDIPAVPEQTQTDAPTELKPPAPTTVSSRIIQIHTDVLQMAIDLDGGDIIELSLPKYLAELDNPNKPFVLLEDNESLIYVAQSGLIGENGIDSSERAKYTSTAKRYSLTEGLDALTVDLIWEGNGDIKITKRLNLRRGDYLVDVEYLVENNSSERCRRNA